eukprot:m.173225 g.173225  ORF g.173225 m.173225 type:complete len:673 (+) comp18296_c0_seq18:64-2082(+)
MAPCCGFPLRSIVLVGTIIGFTECAPVASSPSKCSVHVERQISVTACVLGKSFGCYDGNNSMWTNDGCMAVFVCNNVSDVPCESHKNPKVGKLFAQCPCVPGPAPPPHPAPGPPPPPSGPVPHCPNRPGGVCPNIVFLIDESTDGRTYRPDGFAPTVLPNVRALADRGVQFDTHYVNAPVCCPSRASIWSGRQPHNIPHQQIDNPSLLVKGAWNNYEGNPPDYDDLLGDVLQRRGYSVQISGKTDWSAGGHSLNVRLNSWTMYTQFPYNVNKTGGWYDESMCPSNGSISSDRKVERHADWHDVNSTTQWIKEQAYGQKTAMESGDEQRPFFAYQGMNIVHPAYVTNEYWIEKIDMSKVTVPAWEPLKNLHPCDFQASMLKKCVPADQDAAAFYSFDRRKRIRSIYYAMISEFDAMVGAYVAAVEESGVTNNTIFIVTSDHGDMNMEHQQFYKMVQYDASARVPLVMAGPGIDHQPLFTMPTQHVDLFPTITDMAEVPKSDLPTVLDGQSLLGYLTAGGTAEHHDFVVSQFHGCNIAMSWYLAVNGTYKYVVFGTGKEVPPQLFDLEHDVAEMHNLADTLPHVVAEFDAKLRTIVDYESVSQDVAQYNKDSFLAWQNRTKDWEQQVATGRWADPFTVDRAASLKAINDWLAEDAKPKACRSELVYPPVHDGEL